MIVFIYNRAHQVTQAEVEEMEKLWVLYFMELIQY